MNFSHFETFLPLLTEYFERQVKSFEAGQLNKHMPDWQKLTSDTEILTLVSGLQIEFIFDKQLITSTFKIRVCNFANGNKQTFRQKSSGPLRNEPGEILSPVFLRGKPNGSHRLILNLKEANERIEKLHFKMETIYTVISMITPSCFIASVDLKELTTLLQ